MIREHRGAESLRGEFLGGVKLQEEGTARKAAGATKAPNRGVFWSALGLQLARTNGPRPRHLVVAKRCFHSMKSSLRADIDAARRSLEMRLTALPPERLVAFVARLAEDDPRVYRQVVDLFAAQRPSSALAQRIEKRIAKVFAEAPKYRWNEAAALASELHEVLELIERELLPAAPASAFALLADFIGRDSAAMESADDSYAEIGGVFRLASEIFAAASKQVPSLEALPVWERLIEGDQYGCRSELPRLIVAGLAAPEVDTVIAKLREMMLAGGESAGRAAWRLKAIAGARHDPDLFAEAAYHGGYRNKAPNIALEVARLFLAAGRAQEALEHLPPSAQGCWHADGDWYETRADIAHALGDTEGECRTRWERFRAAPSAERLAEALASTPEAEHAARRIEARDFVRAGGANVIAAMRFFVAIDEPEESAHIALTRAKELNGGLYFDLLPLAEKLDAAFPLAATALFRALVDSILARKQPKTYAHGAAYWHRLAKLAARIGVWTPLAPHATYVEQLRTTHRLKRAFWTAVDRHDSDGWAQRQTHRRELLDKSGAYEPGEEPDDEDDLD